MEVGEAGPLTHSEQQSPCQVFDVRAPRWRPLAGRAEAMRAASRCHISRLRGEETEETQNQPWTQGEGTPGWSARQQSETRLQGLVPPSQGLRS